MRKNCKTFEEWYMSQYNEFQKVKEQSRALEICTGSKKATYYATIFNTKTGKAVCETVNMRCGRSLNKICAMAIGLAWASYKGENVPSFKKLVSISDIKNGTPFETPSGTYIKIGYDPRSDSYVCTSLSGKNKYYNFKVSSKVYTAS